MSVRTKGSAFCRLVHRVSTVYKSRFSCQGSVGGSQRQNITSEIVRDAEV